MLNPGVERQASPGAGGVQTSGARLYEPQRFSMQTKPLRVADPRSENKSGRYPKAPGTARRFCWQRPQIRATL